MPPQRSPRRRVHPFLFFGASHREGDFEPYPARGMLCLPHLLAALSAEGHQLGEIILNMPPHKGEAKDAVAPIAIRLMATDTLLIVTRFPLDDGMDDRKRRLRGFTDLEGIVFAAAARVFERLSRQRMTLRPELWPHARAGLENRVNVTYHSRSGARFRELRRTERGRREKPPAEPRTSAFLLNLELRPGGPRMIAAFGMDSLTTLVWSQILASRHPGWLTQPGFTMVDLILEHVPLRPTLLRFAQDWRYEIVMRVRM